MASPPPLTERIAEPPRGAGNSSVEAEASTITADTTSRRCGRRAQWAGVAPQGEVCRATPPRGEISSPTLVPIRVGAITSPSGVESAASAPIAAIMGRRPPARRGVADRPAAQEIQCRVSGRASPLRERFDLPRRFAGSSLPRPLRPRASPHPSAILDRRRRSRREQIAAPQRGEHGIPAMAVVVAFGEGRRDHQNARVGAGDADHSPPRRARGRIISPPSSSSLSSSPPVPAQTALSKAKMLPSEATTSDSPL